MTAPSQLPATTRHLPSDLAPALELMRGLGILLSADELLDLVGVELFPPVHLIRGELRISRSIFRQWAVENGHDLGGAA